MIVIDNTETLHTVKKFITSTNDDVGSMKINKIFGDYKPKFTEMLKYINLESTTAHHFNDPNL